MEQTRNGFTLEDIHYNSKGVLQVSAIERFEDMAKTLKSIEQEFTSGTKLEQNMFLFFHNLIEPIMAYKDNEVNQGEYGPRRLCIVGKFEEPNNSEGLFIRLGISAPGESLLMPCLQALYLDPKIQPNSKEKPISEFDSWFYGFTDVYNGRLEGAHLVSRKGIDSLLPIYLINESILEGKPVRITFDKVKYTD
jgi:hypothetical protein